jgi:hypothetical protein
MDDRAHDAGTPVERAAEFELEGALAKWRAGFAEISERELDELSDHLCEEFARLESFGLTRGEAWLIATRRLGAPSAIEVEFARVSGFRRARSFLFTFLGLVLAMRLTEAVVNTAMSLAFRFGRSAYLAAGIVCSIVAFIALIRGVPRLLSWARGLAALRFRSWIACGLGYIVALAAVHIVEIEAAKLGLNGVAEDRLLDVPMLFVAHDWLILSLACLLLARREGSSASRMQGDSVEVR